jgi:hypothetical protein
MSSVGGQELRNEDKSSPLRTPDTLQCRAAIFSEINALFMDRRFYFARLPVILIPVWNKWAGDH